MQILVAEDSLKTEKSVASLFRKGWRFLPGLARGTPQLTLTYYYPYYFQSWKATIPKTLARTMKMRLFTGVDGTNRAVGLATEWPVRRQRVVKAEEVIPSQASEAEVEQFSQEYIKEYVTRRYRPSEPPTIQREKSEMVYVAYYVYVKENQPLYKADLVEGLTGSRGRVKDVPTIYETVREGEMFTGVGEGR